MSRRRQQSLYCSEEQHSRGLRRFLKTTLKKPLVRNSNILARIEIYYQAVDF